MSIVDKIVAAVMPPESAKERARARSIARAMADPQDWLSQILDHHEGIETAFAAVREAETGPARSRALKRLGIVLTGHAQAEETVIYPGLASNGEKVHATDGYDEQAMVKMHMAFLESLDPMSQEFHGKLGHIESAVADHIYAEEHGWLVNLKAKAVFADQTRWTRRYAEEYDRYVGHPEPI